MVAVFSSAQDSENWPGVVKVSEDSVLYLDFIAVLKLNESLSALSTATQQANLQVSALTGRVDTLDFAVSEGDASQAEVKELPVRKNQLKQWRRYNRDLGRVPGQPGWPDSHSWPTQPESYLGV
ncbi:hypothetical protein [Pseudomonas sp. DWP1b1]|uniref:hypothetical protein n=1 Tax=unclassified Pseudomonas TaxID=196821 RepID=UPI003CFB2F4E